MNPDGAAQANIGDCDSEEGKMNANNVDLDSNFVGQLRINQFPKNKGNYPCVSEEYILICDQEKNRIQIVESGDRAPSLEPEVLAVMNWTKEYNFVTSVALQGGALVAKYPFDKPNPEGTHVQF